MASHRVAVLLAGSGVYDGSEVHEASAALVALSRHNAQISCFAPDKRQLHAINHCAGAPMKRLETLSKKARQVDFGDKDRAMLIWIFENINSGTKSDNLKALIEEDNFSVSYFEYDRSSNSKSES